MVVCVIALIVFGLLSIFSASHRQIAKEAFDCVFRKVTLRPCNTGLDKRLKMMVSVKVMQRNEKVGKFVHTHFESISLAFTALFVLSMMFSGIGIYNFWAYGNCNGANSSELCLLNPETYSGTNTLAWLFPPTPTNVKMVTYDGLPMQGTPGAKITIVEVGCFTCPFTKGTELLVEEVMEKYKGGVALYFKYFPLPKHNYSAKAAEAAECAREQGKFWEYKEKLFLRQLECVSQPDEASLLELYKTFASDMNLNSRQFDTCLDSDKYTGYIETQKQQSIDAGIYGTPTFFINGKVLVAPKTIEEFSKIIDTELMKNE